MYVRFSADVHWTAWHYLEALLLFVGCSFFAVHLSFSRFSLGLILTFIMFPFEVLRLLSFHTCSMIWLHFETDIVNLLASPSGSEINLSWPGGI
jgi:hypothetical protein